MKSLVDTNIIDTKQTVCDRRKTFRRDVGHRGTRTPAATVRRVLRNYAITILLLLCVFVAITISFVRRFSVVRTRCERRRRRSEKKTRVRRDAFQ